MSLVKYTKYVDAYGSRIEVEWTGSVWVSPHNGMQHGRAEDAMRSELRAFFQSCGAGWEDIENLIDEHLPLMKYTVDEVENDGDDDE